MRTRALIFLSGVTLGVVLSTMLAEAVPTRQSETWANASPDQARPRLPTEAERARRGTRVLERRTRRTELTVLGMPLPDTGG